MAQTVTFKELSEATGIDRRVIFRRWKKEQWPAVVVTGRGGERHELIVHSLPGDMQNSYLNARKPCTEAGPQPAAAEAEADASSLTLPAVRDDAPAPSRRETAAPPVSLREIIPSLAAAPVAGDGWQELPEASRAKGYDVLLLVNKVRDILARTPRKGKVAALKQFAAVAGHDYRSLYRYLQRADAALAAAQKAGTDTIMAQIAALTPKWGRTRGRVQAFDRNAVIFAFSVFETEKMTTMRDVYEATVSAAQGNGWRIGSYASLCNYLNRIDPATKTLAREGKQAFEAAHQLKVLRDYNEIAPNFMWCGDHHIFDVFVKLPDGKGGWRFKRPWVTAWLDMRSRSFMGWCINFAPNSRTIAMALAHGITRKDDPSFPQHGLPASVYVDRGKDYRSQYLNGEEIAIGTIDYPDIIERFAALGIDPFYIDLEFDPQQNAWVKKHGDRLLEIKGVRVGGVYARMGIGQKYATAYHPWAKPIERSFRTVVQSFSRDLPGWCGSGHDQRPDKLAFELRSAQVLTLEEFCERWYGWVVNVYHKRPHRGHGMDGRSPDEIFASLLPQPTACEPALLDFALMKKDRVKMHNWGFTLEGRQFEPDLPTNLQGGQILNILIGSWVTVFYDFDFKTVRIYRDGTWYCNARPLNRASMLIASDKVMVDKLKLAAYQKRAATGQISAIMQDPVVVRERNEREALLAITHAAESNANEGENLDVAAAEYSPGADEAAAAADTGAAAPGPEAAEEPIYITRAERYSCQIVPKLARGIALTEEQQRFREQFEISTEYLDSQSLYEATLEYERYRAGGAS